LARSIIILEGIERGVDMFDCVLPTRIARHGTLMTSQGRVNIQGAQYKEDFTPLDPMNAIAIPAPITPKPISTTFHDQRGIWQALNSIHNIRFLINMMEGARKAIQEDRFKAYKDEIIAKYGDERGF
jgi:queuine tRNA-ribosyltransferase